MSEPIFHITDRESWERALQEEVYVAPSLFSEGFIHCSAREQVTRVADALYAERDRLLLLEIDPGELDAEVRWEGEEERFPHVYGAIPLDAVGRVAPLERDASGRFAFPPELA